MASSKKSSTSKTARVMNLLSKSREEVPVEQPVAPAPEVAAPPVQAAPAAEAAVVPAPAPAPAPTPAAHTTHTTPLISSMQTDSAISNQVLSALENALEDELKVEQPESPVTAPAAPVEPIADEPVAETSEEQVPTPIAAVPAEEPVAVETAPVPEAVAETAAEAIMEEPVAAPVSPAPIPVPAPVSEEPDKEPAPPTQFKVDANTTYVNVMETLVEEKANKYIDLFGLCKCHRCVADVKAYALNHLNPKYVVMRTGEVIPRITVYENQFSAVVTAQILNACKIVMASPRHEQP